MKDKFSLNDRNPDYHLLADKLRVKEIIKKRLERIIVKLIDHWDSQNHIDFSKLPNKFVLKLIMDVGLIS